MKPIIPNCFPVSTFLFSHDSRDILYRNKISTCTSRSEEYQNKKWNTNGGNATISYT